LRTIAKNRKKVDAEFCGWYILRHKNSNQRQKMNALHNNVVSFPLSHASFSSYNPISEQDALSSLQDLFNRAGERHKDNERLVAHVEKSTKVCSVTITPFQDLEMAFTALIEKVNKNWKNLHNDSRFNFFKELIGFRLQWIKEGNERMIKIEEIERNYSQSLSFLPNVLQTLVRQYSSKSFFLKTLSNDHRVLDLSGLNVTDDMLESLPQGLRILDLSQCTGLTMCAVLGGIDPPLEKLTLPDGTELAGEEAIQKACGDYSVYKFL